ncbi:hypothetical protein ScPMuIL_013569 [Solemya velum]
MVHGPKMITCRTFTMALLLLTILPKVLPRTPTPQTCKRAFHMCIKGKDSRRDCEKKRDLCLSRYCVEDLKDRFSGSRAAYFGKLVWCAKEHGLVYSKLWQQTNTMPMPQNNENSDITRGMGRQNNENSDITRGMGRQNKENTDITRGVGCQNNEDTDITR